MSLPTSGYTASKIEYTVAVEGISLTFTVTLDATTMGATLAENVATALEPALVTLAGDMESVPGASTGHVYKFFTGGINVGDVA